MIWKAKKSLESMEVYEYGIIYLINTIMEAEIYQAGCKVEKIYDLYNPGLCHHHFLPW